MLETKGVSIIRNAATAVLLACLQSACGSDGDTVSTIDVGSEESLTMSWEEFRQQAVRGTVAGKTIYAIDGDVFTDSEDDLREYYDAMRADGYEEKLAVFKQQSTGFEGTFPAATALNIKYCVSDQFASFSPSKATMVTAMQAATAAWQQHANVRFTYLSANDASCTEANAAIDFAVVPSTNASYSGCGTNKLRWSGGCPITGPYTASAARGVLAVNYPLIPAFVTLNGLLLHELGHVLGFRHEHPWGPSGCGGVETPDIPSLDMTGRRLTDYDIPSVMHYQGVCGKANIDYTISALDGVGSRQVYGIPAAWSVPLLQVLN